VHKQLPEYMITEDDADLVVEKVQDHAAEEFEEAQHQRGQIQDELEDIRQVLEQIRDQHKGLERGIKPFPTTTEVEARTVE
jgi:flagellar biosynthesis chaperone FliJ